MRVRRSAQLAGFCLWGMAIWAMVLSIETWIRTPGSLLGRPLPARQLQLDGERYVRVGKEKGRAVKELPSSAFLVRHWLVNYRRVPYTGTVAEGLLPQKGSSAHQPAESLELAFIEATGSGKANRLPIGRLQDWMNGKAGQTNGCLVRQVDGTMRLIRATSSIRTVTVPTAGSNPGRVAAWMSGLRPIEEVRCAWISSDSSMTNEALRQIGNTVLP